MEISTVSGPTIDEPQVSSNGAAFYVYLTLGSLGLIGNAFVCLVMIRYRNVFNSSTNKLIIHQSAVDFLTCLVFILRLCLVISPGNVPQNTLGTFYCKLWSSSLPQFALFITSSYNLVAISIERYYATCQPIRHRNLFSSRRLKIIMAAAWICGWVPESHAVFIAQRIAGDCSFIWPSPETQALGGFLVFSIEIFIPIAVIIFAYTKIISELRTRSRARAEDNNQDARNMLSRANKNVTKTLLVVAVFFGICWTPASISYLLFNFGINSFVSYNSALPAVTTIVTVNLCINPVIYCFTYERFQKQAKKMICGGYQHNVNRVDTTSGSTRQVTNAQHTAQVSVISAPSIPHVEP
ncbi:neuropeptide Y receptor type 6-like [Asterias rubens]|uniref:neuropeptide Y receptor type 6-like n=1 Tax=Asterias rubens TaxID=7604 RepID=UPI0014550299|nr:neuropeptide Y receptor type 6-like [Asterias rubens]